jgi:hypothetical protein
LAEAAQHLRVEALRVLSYDPMTGVLHWRVDRGRCAKAGDVAGGLNNEGYVTLTVCGQRMKAHRLVFLLQMGRLPRGEVDHINGNRADNRWSNLRDVPKNVNQHNRWFARKDSRQPAQGVQTMGKNGRFWARIRVNKRDIYLGSFDTEAEAERAYLAAKREQIACGC